MSHREARVAVSEQDHITRSRNNSRSRQMEANEKACPARVPSSDLISTTDAEEQSSTSQEDSASNFSLRDSAVATRQVILNQNLERNRSSLFQVSTQPGIFTTTMHIPSPMSHRKLSGILELSVPTKQTSKVGNETTVASHSQLPTSCPTSVHNLAHRPSHFLQKNTKLASDSSSPRVRYLTSLNASAGEAEDMAEARRTAYGNSAYNSEEEEELRQPSRAAAGSPPRRESVETRRGLSEIGEHVKKVEFTKRPSRNQFLTDNPDVRRSTQRLPGNDTTVNKSGSFSIPARSTYVPQLRLGLRTPSPAFASRRPDLSPRSLVSTSSMISLDGRRSKIPRPIQKSPRTSTPNPPKVDPVLPYEIRYSVFNVFSIIMTPSSDDWADRLDLLSTAIVAKESVVEEHSKCEVQMHRSYIHPTVHKIQTYEPVKISTKRSEVISAVVSIEEPKVMRTLANIAKVGPAERTDKHIITLTEFRDAVRVYEPVVPTNKQTVAKPNNVDKMTSAQPPADRVAETSTQKIISMIPPVVLASAHVKKQKRSKSVQSKVPHSIKPSVRHAVQCSVQPVFQSSIHPGVHSSLPTMVQHSVKPLAQPLVQRAAQSLVQSVIHPAVRPGRKTSSLMSEIVEVSFTDLDKKAFRPQQLTASSGTKTKTRNSKDAGRNSTATKAESPSDPSPEGRLTTASRSALKAIVRAILANTGVQLPEQRSGNRKDIPEKAAGVHRHSHPKTTLSVMVPSVPAAQRKNWSLDEVNRPTGNIPARQVRTEPSTGENFLGRHPLGSSVTQVFCKHRKEEHHHHHHHRQSQPDESMSWSKALYAKTLYFQNDTKENQQRPTNARNALSSGHILSSTTNSNTGNSDLFGEDRPFGHEPFRSIGMMSEKQSANISSSNSVSTKIDETFASLEQTVSSFLLSQYRKIHPVPVTS